VPLVDLPPASPELNPAERVFEELRRAVEGKVYPTLDEKVAAVDAELRRIEADPPCVRRLTGWDWINAAIQDLPTDHSA
jgi:transposase